MLYCANTVKLLYLLRYVLYCIVLLKIVACVISKYFSYNISNTYVINIGINKINFKYYCLLFLDFTWSHYLLIEYQIIMCIFDNIVNWII